MYKVYSSIIFPFPLGVCLSRSLLIDSETLQDADVHKYPLPSY